MSDEKDCFSSLSEGRESQDLESSNVGEKNSSNRSSGTSSSSNSDHAEVLAEVLQLLRLELVPALAVKLRQEEASRTSHISAFSPFDLDATVESVPLHGSYNFLFPINFNDGARWLIKVPQRATIESFGDREKRALISEAVLMTRLKQETDVPVPKIFGFSATFAELGYPYILMEFVQGSLLTDVWQEDGKPSEIEARRTQALDGIAAAMVQLSSWTYTKAGNLIFDEYGTLKGYDDPEFIDIVATHNATTEESSFAQNQITYSFKPFESVRRYFMDHVDRRRHVAGLSDLEIGALDIIKLFIERLPEDHEEDRFVINHPDFSLHNCLVSSEGKLLALIDWDKVDSVPKAVGNLRFPNFLIQDWDPSVYACHAAVECCPQDPPEALAFYREIYADRIMVHAAAQSPQVPVTASSLASIQASGRTTRQSLIWESLFQAATDSLSTVGIVEKIFFEILHLIDADPELEWDRESSLEAPSISSEVDSQSVTSDEAKPQIPNEDDRLGNAPNTTLDLDNKNALSYDIDQGEPLEQHGHAASVDAKHEAGSLEEASSDYHSPPPQSSGRDLRYSLFVFDWCDGTLDHRYIETLCKGFEMLLNQV